jgi:hypothetical protein
MWLQVERVTSKVSQDLHMLTLSRKGVWLKGGDRQAISKLSEKSNVLSGDARSDMRLGILERFDDLLDPLEIDVLSNCMR